MDFNTANSSLEKKLCLSLHENFDYNSTKKAFQQELEFVLLKFKLHNKVMLHKSTADSMILDMTVHKRSFKLFGPNRYYIAVENDRNILCSVTWSNKVPHKMLTLQQILSVEEMFDVIAELHASQPVLSFEEFVNKLSNCEIPHCFVRLVWRACICCVHQKIWYKAVVEMSILTMRSPNDDICRVLMYIDKYTNFILLRPLKTIQTEEVANELLSIFCDFGFTRDMDCNMRPLFKEVFQLFQPLSNLIMSPSVYSTCREHKISIMEKKVRDMIRECLNKSKSMNWVIGTHIVQWKLNTTPVLDTYIRSKVVRGPIENPYHAMFGILPNTDQVKFSHDISAPEADYDAQFCSQCHKRVYKVYECNFCLSICHFMCCRRIVEETNEIPFLINKCISCDSNMSEETILGA